ncbi:MAG: CHRD domain-containing protein [Ornithinimicrobium sp.]
MRTTKKHLAPLAIAAIVGLPFAVAAPASAQDDSTELTANLSQLNDSGVSGTAWGMLEGNMLEIKIEADGLLADAPHAQHIHIGGQNACPDPTMEGTGFEGAIRTLDAADSYGGVQVSLTTEPGETTPEAALDVENFPTGPTVNYERTIELPDDVAADIAAGDGVVVLHGVDHNGSGTYDGDQESDLDPNLPSEATDPAACGEFDVAQMSMPEDGVATGGGSTEGTENAGVLALGAVALGAGAFGVAATRRRGADARR